MSVSICEVGPRDGLQNESKVLSVSERVELIERLVASGLALLEAASFVNLALVPQMDGSEDVLRSIHRSSVACYAGLVLNARGAERALAAKIDLIRYVVPATDSFARRNQGDRSVCIAEFTRVVALARQKGVRCVAVIAVAFGCPFEGKVAPAAVVDLAAELCQGGASEIVLADTIGVAIPDRVTALFAAAQAQVGQISLGGHFHQHSELGPSELYRRDKRWSWRP
jgi:isopropylmalate/homocitrate/citramalate synthase